MGGGAFVTLAKTRRNSVTRARNRLVCDAVSVTLVLASPSPALRSSSKRKNPLSAKAEASPASPCYASAAVRLLFSSVFAGVLAGFLGLVLVGACAHQDAKPLNVNVPVSRPDEARSDLAFAGKASAPNVAPDQVGLATWYGQSFAGKKTTNGERFDPRAMTAAHRSLPFGTWVEVRRPDTGSSVRVRINDRGPFGDSRKVIDLSQHAAQLLGIIDMGAARVELRVVRGPE